MRGNHFLVHGHKKDLPHITCIFHFLNVSQSDIVGPIDYLSDIENLVSFERVMFQDYSIQYQIQIF